MTPTQLRAFAAVVRLGSVKQAAADLDVSEAAVSLHVGQLRKELGDKLFTRTAAGLAFTPGGLRLASRAAEMLGLQDRTILEVSQAGGGPPAAARRRVEPVRRALRARPDRAVRRAGPTTSTSSSACTTRATSARLLQSRAVDVAIGPQPGDRRRRPSTASRC